VLSYKEYKERKELLEAEASSAFEAVNILMDRMNLNGTGLVSGVLMLCDRLEEAEARIKELEGIKAPYEFYVCMMRRRDGEIYPDLHKTDHEIYFTREEVVADDQS
jgi:hypothetical protein